MFLNTLRFERMRCDIHLDRDIFDGKIRLNWVAGAAQQYAHAAINSIQRCKLDLFQYSASQAQSEEGAYRIERIIHGTRHHVFLRFQIRVCSL